MAVRVREDGRVLCAARHPERPGDIYIDDGVHYLLSAKLRLLVTEEMDQEGGLGGHRQHGEWWWWGNVPERARISSFYSDGR